GLAEGIPEPFQLAACLLEDLADRLLPVLRALDQLRPDLGLVAESGHVERHKRSFPTRLRSAPNTTHSEPERRCAGLRTREATRRRFRVHRESTPLAPSASEQTP